MVGLKSENPLSLLVLNNAWPYLGNPECSQQWWRKQMLGGIHVNSCIGQLMESVPILLMAKMTRIKQPSLEINIYGGKYNVHMWKHQWVGRFQETGSRISTSGRPSRGRTLSDELMEEQQQWGQNLVSLKKNVWWWGLLLRNSLNCCDILSATLCFFILYRAPTRMHQDWLFQSFLDQTGTTQNGFFRWRVLTAHTEWLPRVRLRHFSTSCAVYIEDCEGWWLSSCFSSVAEHWLHKPGILGLIPSDCQPFHFSSIFASKTSNL